MSAADWIAPAVAGMSAYQVPEIPAEVLRLSDMECPQDLDPALRTQWLEHLAKVALNRYPPPHSAALETLLRAQFDIPQTYPLLFGNGSDELIQIILLSLRQEGRVVLSLAPSFVMYRLVAEMLGMRYVGVPLDAQFALDCKAMLDAIAREQPAVVFLAQPNNPTGGIYPREELRAIIAAAPGLVVLDEAYRPYSAQDFSDLLAEFSNVVVLRTLSKMGFAGLRFGYLFGHSDWMAAFAKVKPPYNVNVLTLASVTFALQHFDFTAQQTATIVKEREWWRGRYSELAGVTVYPAEGNFLLLRVAKAAAIFQKMLAAGVRVKCLAEGDPLLADCLRITIADPEANARCFAAFCAARES